jgi:hypothetical protein
MWPPVYYDANMNLKSNGPTQQCQRSVTTVLQQTHETVMHIRSGSAVNPGNLHSFCKGNAFVKHGEENCFSLQSDSDTEVTTLVQYITNTPAYYVINTQCVSQQL